MLPVSVVQQQRYAVVQAAKSLSVDGGSAYGWLRLIDRLPIAAKSIASS